MTSPSPPDWRGLCEELVSELHGYAAASPYHDSDALVIRAYAALAQPKPEVVGPTDEELWQVGDEDFRANTWPTDAIRYARAVLARYGHQPAPPAEGEVAELVAWLRMQGEAQIPED